MILMLNRDVKVLVWGDSPQTTAPIIISKWRDLKAGQKFKVVGALKGGQQYGERIYDRDVFDVDLGDAASFATVNADDATVVEGSATNPTTMSPATPTPTPTKTNWLPWVIGGGALLWLLKGKK